MDNMKKLYLKFSAKSGNVPLDLKIIGILVEIIALLFFLLGLLFVLKIGKTTQPFTRPALFGTLSLSSDISIGINCLTISSFAFFSGFGIFKGYRFGVWILFILLADGVFTNILMFSEYKKTVFVTLTIELILVIWLFCRRQFYK